MFDPSAAVLFLLHFSLFEAGIADAIFSFKWHIIWFKSVWNRTYKGPAGQGLTPINPFTAKYDYDRFICFINC